MLGRHADNQRSALKALLSVWAAVGSCTAKRRAVITAVALCTATYCATCTQHLRMLQLKQQVESLLQRTDSILSRSSGHSASNHKSLAESPLQR
jgi:hypothetical protein